MPTNFILFTRGLIRQVNYYFIIINNYHFKKDNGIIELIDTPTLLVFFHRPPIFLGMREGPVSKSYIFKSDVNIHSSAASSSKETDLKRILSHGLCFSAERRVIFPLKMWNARIIYFLSICWNDAPNVNLHTENKVTFIVDQGKKKARKATTKFSPYVFKIPTSRGSNEIWW